MCTRCERPVSDLPVISAASAWNPRRAFLLAAAGAVLAKPALAQVDVGKPSVARNIVSVEQVETAGVQQYGQLLEQARAKGALAGESNPQLQRLRAIAKRLIPFATPWNARARDWKWEVNLIGSKQINAFCMPGGKIAFFTGILDQLKLTDDEVAMVMGHEMAHALREHARARMAKSAGTGAALSIGAQLLGWGQVGDLAARAGTQLITLKFSRGDESEADLVGLELAARAGYDPKASVSLWQKMAAASKSQGGLNFLSTHPSGPDRIAKLEANLPKVEKLYREARK
ncbi:MULTISPECIES: M48 family metallopeptidase [unclassified Variovorax]|jgi:Zn-dependent protease with chaperone function|uniref:M48 family metallopeptidase n=1 Tax=unclassified Variovorax TaxID=663243 RepID=UPI000F7E68B7|nr:MULTISPECIES: M48 family metallopeptidase [unclassified Variovorax]RSZ42343.1 M48 family peptidase [Variovorax sp. 553]RSZ43319.1 M48 family peptidase [Variovorax sp. 679]